MRYVENHREELKAEYTKFDDYMKHFEVGHRYPEHADPAGDR